MNKKLFIFLIIIIIFFSSCSENLYDMIKVLDAEPNISKPMIDHFAKESVIIIEWEKDKYADEYILYKDNDPEGNFENIIYQGDKTKYEDTDVRENCFYYYKLAKKRGNKIFPKSGYAYTVCHISAKDDYENNNYRSDDNFEILSDINLNLYCFTDRLGNTIEDYDWFKTTLGPKSSLQISIVLEAGSNLLTNELLIQKSHELSSDTISYGDAFLITNEMDEERIIYFRIFFDDLVFSGDPLYDPTGQGKFGYYTINFMQKL